MYERKLTTQLNKYKSAFFSPRLPQAETARDVAKD